MDAATRHWLTRLRGMGLEAQEVPGGRSVRAVLPLQGAPFPGIAGPRYFGSVTIATVGPARIKCMAPLPLFQLPLVEVGGCTRARDLETRIRRAWHELQQELRMATTRLAALGLELRHELDGASASVPLGLDDAEARARLGPGGSLVLPGRGPLSGLALEDPRQRRVPVDRSWETASDLEIALTTRLEALARRASRARARAQAPAADARPPVGGGERRVLLVGGVLARDTALADSLRRAQLRVRVEMSAQDAVDAFSRQSFDLVLVDAHLGRQEGLDLVPELSRLPGIASLPVVLVDERRRDSVREAARRAGAAGYLVHPVQPEKVTPGLLRMASGHRGRRFQRFSQRLAVRFDGEAGGTTVSVGRLGMLVCGSGASLPRLGVCAIHVPELERWVHVEAEAAYRVDGLDGIDGQGRIGNGTRGAAGTGFRFRAFSGRDEATWIDYVGALCGSVAGRA